MDRALEFCIVLMTLSGRPAAFIFSHSLARPTVPGVLDEDERPPACDRSSLRSGRDCRWRVIFPGPGEFLLWCAALTCCCIHTRSLSPRNAKAGGWASCSLRKGLARRWRGRSLRLPWYAELQGLVIHFLLLASLLHPCQR